MLSENDTVEIDSRTSDAMALAVRFGCPIYTYENILESAGILMEDTAGSGKGKKKKVKQEVMVEEDRPTGNEELKTMTFEELNPLLNDVLGRRRLYPGYCYQG